MRDPGRPETLLAARTSVVGSRLDRSGLAFGCCCLTVAVAAAVAAAAKTTRAELFRHALRVAGLQRMLKQLPDSAVKQVQQEWPPWRSESAANVEDEGEGEEDPGRMARWAAGWWSTSGRSRWVEAPCCATGGPALQRSVACGFERWTHEATKLRAFGSRLLTKREALSWGRTCCLAMVCDKRRTGRFAGRHWTGESAKNEEAGGGSHWPKPSKWGFGSVQNFPRRHSWREGSEEAACRCCCLGAKWSGCRCSVWKYCCGCWRACALAGHSCSLLCPYKIATGRERGPGATVISGHGSVQQFVDRGGLRSLPAAVESCGAADGGALSGGGPLVLAEAKEDVDVPVWS